MITFIYFLYFLTHINSLSLTQNVKSKPLTAPKNNTQTIPTQVKQNNTQTIPTQVKQNNTEPLILMPGIQISSKEHTIKGETTYSDEEKLIEVYNIKFE